MSTFGRKTSSQSARVFLNVYDLNEQSNEYLYPLGLGLYHSGVEISGIEYTFAGESGIYEMTPKNAPPAKFRESIDLGPSPTSREISNAIEELRHDFKGTDYHVLNKNCNHFAGCSNLQVLS
jgi:deubiquitinase DESI2